MRATSARGISRQSMAQEDRVKVIGAEEQSRGGVTGRRWTRRWSGRRLRVALLGCVLLALLGAAGLFRWQAKRDTRRSTVAAPGEDPAESRLRRAVEAKPSDVAARMALGGYYEGQARPFEAMWEYVEARRLSPSAPALPGHLAAVLRECEDIDQAVELLEGAVKARPGDLALRGQLADLYLARAEPLQAREVMEERREEVWQDADTAIVLGRALQAGGEDVGAVAAYQRAMALAPDGHEARYRLGRLYLAQGKSDQARDAFFHAMLRQQSRPDYPFYAGMAYLQQGGKGDTERALRFFKDALALNGKYAPAHYETGRALEQMGRRPAALSSYSFAAIADPGHAEALRALGQGLAAVGNIPDAHRYMGRYYDLKDRPSDAVAEFHRMAAAAPKSVEPALLIGQVTMRTGESLQAIAVTEAALKRHPDEAQLLERLTVLTINRGDWPAARRLLQRWMTAQPKASRPYWLMGRCELGDQKYPEAVTWLEKAVAAEPRNPHYLGYLGAALLKRDTAPSRERALRTLAEAVALAPDEAEYRDLYGQALQRLGQDEPARRQFLRALQADPARIAAYLAVSQAARRLKRPGPAAHFAAMVRSVQARESEATLLRTGVWRRPGDASARVKLARFFCRTGRLDQARDQLEQALALQPSSREARALMTTVQRCRDVR